MIKVQKAPAPEWFQTWANPPCPDPTHTYENLREKSELKQALLSEQGFLCCYCGRAVTLDNSHNEHFRPQSKYPELALCYDNIHASCSSSSPDPHCGDAKQDTFDEELCISPIDVDERRFLFTHSGHVSPKNTDDASAKHMIEILKLNSSELTIARREILKTLFSSSDGLSHADLQQLHAAYQVRGSDNHFRPFRHVVTSYINNETAAQPPIAPDP